MVRVRSVDHPAGPPVYRLPLHVGMLPRDRGPLAQLRRVPIHQLCFRLLPGLPGRRRAPAAAAAAPAAALAAAATAPIPAPAPAANSPRGGELGVLLGPLVPYPLVAGYLPPQGGELGMLALLPPQVQCGGAPVP